MGRTRLTCAGLALACLVAGCSGNAGRKHTSSPAAGARTTPAAPISSAVAASSSSPAPTSSAAPSPSSTAPRPRPHRSSRPASASASAPASRTQRLPLSFASGRTTQVVTVVAPSGSSSRATVQAWRKVAGGWRTVGPSVPAWVGSAGLSRHTSEGRSATPIGSFTLTQAFGHDPDPGTALPYVRTTPDDWWISETSSPLYNTRRRCSASCGFTRGDPNEHLFYETPFYDDAVVIDYNTVNAPGGVRPGAGSAFFLHVHPAGAGATAGCVAVPKEDLVRIMRWLRPSDAPRILIGVR